MKNIVVFSGAGISAESGLGTFRDSGGLWDKYKIEDVATPQAFKKNPELVLEFYNIRRRQLLSSSPNSAHYALNKLQDNFNLQIITQNIDDLHERSGTKNVLHLHGHLRQSKSTLNEMVYQIEGSELILGDICPNGSQLRPNVVWFGESVPMMEKAIEIVKKAHLFIIIGTSLNVYPAASLIHYTTSSCEKYIIDPNAEHVEDIKVIRELASVSVPKLVDQILEMK
tara:strand:+ start:2754 stop:3431 length:678 start_codon:yes stop_codon:yes gene_type:complete